MKPIILASKSAQRKKLLKLLGLKFKVRSSKAEEVKKITTTPQALVKKNALIKANEIASKLKDGVVIGADSVVYIGNKKIIGKPKSLKEAKKILKILFKSPQWVYTGVAVVDAKTGKQAIGYEKTRVFMSALTDSEIDKYHKKMPPFDKAGGFDIEGVGSVFIRRIEGCYTNVIGLPMQKLGKMLKDFGVSMLGLFFILNLFGCTTSYNLATEQQESLLYATEKEEKIGLSASKNIEKHYDVIDDIDIRERIESILKRIVEVSDRKNVVYFIKVLDKDIKNAVSLPGGYIYIFKGTVDAAETDDQLASVIAHEVGHITAQHGIKRLQGSYGAMAMQVAAATQSNSRVAKGVGVAIGSLFAEHSLADEFEADRLAVKYLTKAGFNPEGAIQFLDKLKKEQENAPRRKFSYWRTHPFIAKRISNINKEIEGELVFRDYLNLTEIDNN
ncbi:MAG: Maf family nucleotide pyrophosphatase [Candidatus Zapsychrus exili]|nr:Maf family nucleotide pyrophosphatase [Candidatus Zapsychrus exili]